VFHDTIHSSVGGSGNLGNTTVSVNGQMGVAALAGFDPIFFLHHCNVDRLFAIWQAANYNGVNSWFDNSNTNETSNKGTFVIPLNQQITSQTGLYPFRTAPGTNYAVSDDVKNWEPYGYTYPELLDTSYKTNPVAFKQKLLNSFNFNLDVVTYILQITDVPKVHLSGFYYIKVFLTYPDRSIDEGVPPQGYVGSINIFSLGNLCTTCQVANVQHGQFILNDAMLKLGVPIDFYPDPNQISFNEQQMAAAIVLQYYDFNNNIVQAPVPGPNITVRIINTQSLAFATAKDEQMKQNLELRSREILAKVDQTKMITPSPSFIDFAKVRRDVSFEEALQDFKRHVTTREE